MLSKQAKSVLKMARKPYEKKVTYNEIEKKFGWGHDKVKIACEQLIRKGYATEYTAPQTMFHGSKITEPPTGIRLTEEGKERWKYNTESLLKIICLNVILPIIVSIATTLITMWVTGYFSST